MSHSAQCAARPPRRRAAARRQPAPRRSPAGAGASRGRRAALAAPLLLALLAGACGEAGPARPEPRPPVLLVGIDGLEWSVLRPLMRQGELPHLRALMERGSYGYLATAVPTHSPILWTSIATGKSSEQHLIQGFLDSTGAAYTSTRRAGRALWNIATEHGLTTSCFGWWITWPVEPIDGVMVAASSASSMLNLNWKPALLPEAPDQVHPPELTGRVMAIAGEAGSLERVRAIARASIFGPIMDEMDAMVEAGELGDTERLTILQSLWSIQSDETYRRVALDVMADHPADLTLVYFGGPDVVGHRFWRQYRPDEFAYGGASEKADAMLADVIPNYYRWIDGVVGELVAAAAPDARVLVVSDHGMHADPSKLERPPRQGVTGNHQDGTPGVLIAAGEGIERQGRVDAFLERGGLTTHGTIYDVAPTVLALLDVPGARDMQGRAYDRILEGAAAASAARPLVESHDFGFRPPRRLEMPDAMNDDFTERFQQLGYVMTSGETTRIVAPDGADGGR